MAETLDGPHGEPAVAEAEARARLSVGEPPAWAIEREIPLVLPDAPGSRAYLLRDAQVDLVGARAWSIRFVMKVLHPEAVAEAAAFRVAFDPTYEQLIVHRARVLRDGEWREHAQVEAFQLLRRELGAERSMYNGNFTADLQLSDVRPGDVVETWFTLVGARPSEQGWFDAREALSWSVPIRQAWFRVRTAADRAMAVRIHPEGQPGLHHTLTQHPDGTAVHEVGAIDLPPMHTEPAIPHGLRVRAEAQICDARTWADVADQFRHAYAPPERLPNDLEGVVAQIAAASSDPSARTIAALRLVRHDVRYLSRTLGDGGLIPRPVEQTWSHRLGDCKDLSRMLVALLQRLDVPAAPALVNQTNGSVLDTVLPGIGAFDHCIVRAQVGGRSFWLDPTSGDRGGDLEHTLEPWAAWALPLVPDAQLERVLPEVMEPMLVRTFEERLVLAARPADGIRFEVRTTHHAWLADDTRARLRRVGPAGLLNEYETFYTRQYKGARSLGPLEITDDLDRNELTVVERYLLTDPWTVKDDVAKLATGDDSFASNLGERPGAGRTLPFQLGRPRTVRRVLKLELPTDIKAEGWERAWSAPGVSATSSVRWTGPRVLELAASFTLTEPRLSADQCAEFVTAVEGFRDNIGLTLTLHLVDGVLAGRRTPVATTTPTTNLPTWEKVRVAIVFLAVFRLLMHLYTG